MAHVRHRQGRRLPRRPGRAPRSWPARRSRPSSSSSTWACRSTARRTAGSTSAASAATPATSARRPVRRACYAADRTGHMILQTLYQQCIKHGRHVLRRVPRRRPARRGRRRWRRRAGGRRRRLPDRRRRAPHLPGQGGPARHRRLRADVPDHLERLLADRRRRRAWPTATASRSRTWSSTSSTRPASTGSASCSPRRPAARAATSSTTAASGSWSATRPTLDGARAARHGQPGDVPWRSGTAGASSGKDYVYLDVRHLGRKVIEEKLPDITDFARIYLGVEPLTEPVPIQPTAHYAMGGIPTDIDARVIRDEHNTVVPGPLRGRRVRLRQRPRRQPPGHQLARRPARLRPAGRAGRWSATSGGAELPEVAADAEEPVRAEIEAAPRARRTASGPAASGASWPT